jgi:hypothetical protein
VGAAGGRRQGKSERATVLTGFHNAFYKAIESGFVCSFPFGKIEVPEFSGETRRSENPGLFLLSFWEDQSS